MQVGVIDLRLKKENQEPVAKTHWFSVAVWLSCARKTETQKKLLILGTAPVFFIQSIHQNNDPVPRQWGGCLRFQHLQTWKCISEAYNFGCVWIQV